MTRKRHFIGIGLVFYLFAIPASAQPVLCGKAKNSAYENNDTTKAFILYREAIARCRQANDRGGEAECWEEYGSALFDYASDRVRALVCYQQARLLYEKCGNPSGVHRALALISLVDKEEGRLDQAVRGLGEADKYFKAEASLSQQVRFEIELANAYWRKGNTQQALYYHREALKAAELLNDDYWISKATNAIGRQFYSLKLYEEALPYFERSFECSGRLGSQSDYVVNLSTVVHDRVRTNKTSGLLEFVKNADKARPSIKDIDRVSIYYSYGLAYSVTGYSRLAERYFLQMIDLFDKAYRQNEYGNNGRLYFQTYNSAIGDFYLGEDSFRKARPYFENIILLPKTAKTPAAESEFQLKLYKIDSALGNYVAAIQHLQIHYQLHDSVFNGTAAKQIADLDERYKADQRSKDLSILRSLQQSQLIQVEHARLQRDITLGMIALVIGVAMVLYWAYRKKQLINRQLALQQVKINDQNLSLKGLLEEKDQFLEEKEILLREKEWLLKEVHHRVKNNLQVITSLLNFQSSSTLTPDALEAIKISRNRIQAISLIHLKLSSGDDLTMVNIGSYVSDLIDHLQDVYDVSNHIRFEKSIDPIDIHISQAVPIGLILNEAITNSIKHAFGEDGGRIELLLKIVGQQMIVLQIADNGRGFTGKTDPARANSLGFKIMRGLATQLKGEFSFNNRGGARIKVEFPLRYPGKTFLFPTSSFSS